MNPAKVEPITIGPNDSRYACCSKIEGRDVLRRIGADDVYRIGFRVWCFEARLENKLVDFSLEIIRRLVGKCQAILQVWRKLDLTIADTSQSPQQHDPVAGELVHAEGSAAVLPGGMRICGEPGTWVRELGRGLVHLAECERPERHILAAVAPRASP